MAAKVRDRRPRRLSRLEPRELPLAAHALSLCKKDEDPPSAGDDEWMMMQLMVSLVNVTVEMYDRNLSLCLVGLAFTQSSVMDTYEQSSSYCLVTLATEDV